DIVGQAVFGIDMVDPAGIVSIDIAAGNVVAAGLAGDLAAGVDGGDGLVDGLHAIDDAGIFELVAVALVVVAVLDGVVGVVVVVPGGIEHLVETAVGVVGDFFVVVAVCRQAGQGFAGPAQAVVAVFFQV